MRQEPHSQVALRPRFWPGKVKVLLNRRQTAEKQKVLDLLKKISPVAWQHIHFLGHYLFRNNHQPIDLEAILAHAGFD
jgi:hypothetical protein